MRGMGRNMHVYLSWQEMRIGITAEDVSWNPDVAEDMANRLHDIWYNALLELNRFGMLDNGQEDEDVDEFGPDPERELQDPRIVYLEDGSEDG